MGSLSTYWCCPSRSCVIFFTCMHLSVFLVLSLFPWNFLVFLWCVHSMPASLLWQCLTATCLLQLCLGHTHCFTLMSGKPAESFLDLTIQRHQDVFLYSFFNLSNYFYSHTLLPATLVFSLVASLLKSVFCDISIFSAVMPRSHAACLTWYGILLYTDHLL